MLVFALAAITIATSFEGGSLGRVERLSPYHLRCAVKGQADQNLRNRQANWYYFRLDRLPKHEIEIDLVDLVGEYNFRPGTHAVTKNTRPAFSNDGRTWSQFTDDQTAWDEKEIRFTLRFRPQHSTMWIAHAVPYLQRDLDRLLATGGPYLTRGVAGHTVHGRDIRLVTITDASAADSGKRVVWLMARQHAWETGTSWIAEGVIRFLISNDPEAARIRRSTVFQILPIFDADGVAEGAVRFNANGYDNNRNWDAIDPKLMPEIATVRQTILAGRADLFLALHNTESSDYVEGPPGKGREFVECLRAGTSFHDPLSPRNAFATPIDKGRMTVAQDLFTERGIPAFLMETMVERHPQLGRPRTVQDFVTFGVGLAKCLAAFALCIRARL